MTKKTLKTKPKKQKVPLSDLTTLEVSSRTFFGIFLTLAFLITGLLYSSCVSASRIAFIPPVIDPNARLERNVHKVVSGYPIEAMTPYIAEHKKLTAAFLVGIAKKESNWGKRVPVDASGNDCFNYWGYRGEGSRGIEMGHGCFGSPEEAIDVVGKRIDTLVGKYKFTTPEEMIVWKCGFNCDGHSPQSVKKWISDVKIYFNKVNNPNNKKPS